MASTFSEEGVLHQSFNEIRRVKVIADDQMETLSRLLGERFRNALRMVENGLVRKHTFQPSGRVIWIVTGKEGEYQVLPHVNFCSCDDFYFRVISNEIFLCYHLIAQRLAEAVDKYVSEGHSDSEYEFLMAGFRRIKSEKRLLSLEETENVRRVIEAILSETGEMSAKNLREEMEKNGLHLTIRHLTNTLTSDRRKRFKCKNGLWFLTERQIRSG